MPYLVLSAISLIFTIAAISFWYFSQKKAAQEIMIRAEEHARQLAEDSGRYAETIKREARLEAKDRFHNMRAEFEKQVRETKHDLQILERRLLQKEENLEKRVEFLDRKEREIREKEDAVNCRETQLHESQKKADALIVEQRRVLEKLADLTAEDARQLLLEQLDLDVRQEGAAILRAFEQEMRHRSTELSREIIVDAIQRTAVDTVIETSVTMVPLPSDDLKGRIIGREGRNIRALEMATGVDLIVDDTPEAILVSAFDGFRREIAKVAVQRLIEDGRIHPARIEEVVERTRSELEEQVLRYGVEAARELEVHHVHEEILKLLGKLRYRTSYGQNVLNHSKEVAYLCAYMASAVDADVHVARRAGLLHDIGKAVEKEAGGTHLDWSIEYAKRYNESPEVIHAIACHHMDIPFETPEAFLVQAADAISAARPGARREILESYVQRLEKLEKIAYSFPGVNKAYALQAGREVRILVDAAKIGDREALWLSKDIARSIEAGMQYPGQIKVTVIREMRVIDFAK